MARPVWPAALAAPLLGAWSYVSHALELQVFAPRVPKAPLLRAGTNVTLVEELGGVLISATGGGGSTGDSDQTLIPGMAFAAPRGLARAFAGGGLTGSYPNPDVVPERLLSGLVPYLPKQGKSTDIRAGSNITITRDLAGVTIAASGGGGSASLTAVTITAPYNVQEWSETVVDAAITPSSKLQVTWGAPSSSDENEPTMDSMTFSAVPGSGLLVITAASEGTFGGPLRLVYLVGA